MFRSLIALAAFALASHLTLASPLTPPAPTDSDTTTTIASTFPVRILEGDFLHPNVTIHAAAAADGRSLAARQEYPASLLLCEAYNCASCFIYNLAVYPFNTCYSSLNFYSVAISQPSGQGLLYAVEVGPAGCASFLAIPAVNTCYNINGPSPFVDFALVL